MLSAPLPPQQRVVAVLTENRIVAGATKQAVIAGGAIRDACELHLNKRARIYGTESAIQNVVAVAAIQDVIAAHAVHLIVAGPAKGGVVQLVVVRCRSNDRKKARSVDVSEARRIP
jgi:hypothetical protein